MDSFGVDNYRHGHVDLLRESSFPGFDNGERKSYAESSAVEGSLFSVFVSPFFFLLLLDLVLLPVHSAWPRSCKYSRHGTDITNTSGSLGCDLGCCFLFVFSGLSLGGVLTIEKYLEIDPVFI